MHLVSKDTNKLIKTHGLVNTVGTSLFLHIIKGDLGIKDYHECGRCKKLYKTDINIAKYRLLIEDKEPHKLGNLKSLEEHLKKCSKIYEVLNLSEEERDASIDKSKNKYLEVKIFRKVKWDKLKEHGLDIFCVKDYGNIYTFYACERCLNENGTSKKSFTYDDKGFIIRGSKVPQEYW